MRRFVIYISLLLLLTSFSPTPANPQSIPKDKTSKTIALIHHKHLYFIRVKLNNKTTNLLIDTGAAASLLDINQANEYDFKFNVTDQKFTGVGGLTNRYRVSNYKFDHDSTTLKIYPFGADLKTVSESFMESGLQVAGVIGSDFLRTNDAIIDYKNNKLIINY